MYMLLGSLRKTYLVVLILFLVQVDDLDIELSSEQSRYQQLAEEKRELEVQMSRLRSGGARVSE